MSQPGRPAAFVVIPEFVVKPDCIDAFLALVRDDAGRSVADEPGCRQFDVTQLEEAPPHVLSHEEVYDSRAAFGGRLQTPHLARFREGFPALVLEERPVRLASRHHG
jgi:quinol monooxygenase YgiN